MCAILTLMKGLIAHPKIEDGDLNELILFAKKNGPYSVPFLTPQGKTTTVVLEVTKRKGGYTRVLLDTYSSNYDISSIGQEDFVKRERNLPDPTDRKDAFCGRRVMSIDVRETGEGLVLLYMLDFLEDAENLEEVKSSFNPRNA